MKKIYGTIYIISLVLGGCVTPPSKMVVLQPGQICVSSYDTIYSIAKAQDISVRELVETNHLRSPYILEEGQILTLPAKVRTPDLPVDDLDIVGGGPVSLAEDSWKDVPLDMPQESSQEMEVLPVPTLPAPESEEEGLSIKNASGRESLVVSEKKALPEKKERERAFEKKKTLFDDSNKKSKQNFSKIQESKNEFKAPVSKPLKRVLDKQTAVFHTNAQDPVFACKDGVVVFSGKCDHFDKDPSLSNKSFVFIKHSNSKGEEWSSVYLGVSPSVKKDQKVKQGDVLGKCQGTVLRFQLRKNRLPVNPENYLKKK
ncbi:membrane-bound metallopeptidase [Holospora obtusa F1]|uniref:Membrane-bound metallopeptidase n=1 Tax=Holospora obtusa F1 TaxID=1399147 RepID=W6TDW3_HOLOB|nr:M23 family metallopeptidase [Holospora obtusa]ETZ07288.1 membrane-bound metallopeptidase [Holospora obtusa F1]